MKRNTTASRISSIFLEGVAHRSHCCHLLRYGMALFNGSMAQPFTALRPHVVQSRYGGHELASSCLIPATNVRQRHEIKHGIINRITRGRGQILLILNRIHRPATGRDRSGLAAFQALSSAVGELVLSKYPDQRRFLAESARLD